VCAQQPALRLSTVVRKRSLDESLSVCVCTELGYKMLHLGYWKKALGIEVVSVRASEIDDPVRRFFEFHHNPKHLFKDICAQNNDGECLICRGPCRGLKGERVDVLVVGPPCQPFSTLGPVRFSANDGEREAISIWMEGPLKGIVEEMIHSSPTWVVIENVEGMAKSHPIYPVKRPRINMVFTILGTEPLKELAQYVANVDDRLEKWEDKGKLEDYLKVSDQKALEMELKPFEAALVCAAKFHVAECSRCHVFRLWNEPAALH
jgi:site-specific DNA-cytosine methylase